MKSSIQYRLENDQTAFAPGELISGSLRYLPRWSTPRMWVHLQWLTLGKGTQDKATVARLEFALPKPGLWLNFALEAPAEPYSFSGRLLSVCWQLEFAADDGQSLQHDIIIAPRRAEMMLPPPLATVGWYGKPILGLKRLSDEAVLAQAQRAVQSA